MTGQTPGICFRETMAGPLMRGEQDYRQGERRGRRAGEFLSMHAAVSIDDIQAFIADPAHAGVLRGCIDYSPFGSGIECNFGSFNLFIPGAESRMKLMVYELGFVHDGREYYLAGRKEVRDNPGFDLWRDTTTLLTRLYQGNDKAGTVIAAGVLTLGVVDLARLVASIEVLHASSLSEKNRTLVAFGRFFMGELWDSYINHGV